MLTQQAMKSLERLNKLTVLVIFSLFIASAAFAGGSEPMKPIQEVEAPAEFDKRTHGKVAVLQWAPPVAAINVTREWAESFKQRNRETLERYIREAAKNGAEMIITSEFGVIGYPDVPELPSADDTYLSREHIGPYVETVPGPTSKFFSKLARELGVYIHVGYAEGDPSTDEYFNVAVALDRSGKLVAKHRKINLYQQEQDYLVPGSTVTAYESDFGRVGLLICADVYAGFPMDDYASAGVDVLALSTSWAQMNTGMHYFRKGAKWAKAYLLAANQPYFPDSGVINPDGSLQSHIRQTNGLAYGYLPRRARHR